MKNVTLKPNPFSSIVTIPALDGRPLEQVSFSQILYRPEILPNVPGTDEPMFDWLSSIVDISEGIEGYDDLDYTHTYTSPIDGKVFKIKVIYFDMSHWSEEQQDDFHAEWNTSIDSLILIF